MGLYEMTGLMGASMMSMFILPAVAMGALIPLAIYLVARWRDRHEHGEHRDHQIGIKLALNLFKLITFQLMLAAIFLFLLGVISEAPTEELVRISIGVGLPSAGLWGLHALFLKRTNAASYPAVSRMFDGWNLIVTAIPGMGGLIALFVVILAPGLDGQRGDVIRVVFPYLLTYGGAWALLAFRWFQRDGLIAAAPPGAGSMGPPQQHYPQQPYPQQPQHQQVQQQPHPHGMPPGPGQPGGGYYSS